MADREVTTEELADYIRRATRKDGEVVVNGGFAEAADRLLALERESAELHSVRDSIESLLSNRENEIHILRTQLAEAQAERDDYRKANAEWRALYDKIPRHELGVPGMHFISVHNRAMNDLRTQLEEAQAEVERLRVQHRYGTPFDPTGAKTGTEIQGLRTQLAERDARVAELEKELARAVLALRDWMHQYAPGECDADDVARSASRVMGRGGTLAYIADVLSALRAAIDSAR